MKKQRFVSLLLVIVLVLSLFPTSAIAADDVTTLALSSVTAFPGSTISMDITVKDNPGILGATLSIAYDEGLTLTAIKAGDAFSALTLTKPGNLSANPFNLVWDGQELDADDIKDGVIATLTFEVSDSVEAGNSLGVRMSYKKGSIVDNSLSAVNVETVDSEVSIIDYLPGDLNGDQEVNTTDVILLRRYIAGGYEVTINTMAADVNDDTEINTTDIIWMRRYLAGGYDIVLQPSHQRCNHTMEATDYKAPSCTETGNIAYWYCTTCQKYFSDAEGLHSIAQVDTILKANGHTVVIDEAVPATYDHTGLTEGSHCSVCLTVLVKQEVIPKPVQNTYPINYKLNPTGDAYLASVEIENPNPGTYTSESGLRPLKEPSVPGYTFEGWYDGSGSSATRITSIHKGESGEIDLYARWSKITYTLSFDCPLYELSSRTYTVDVGATLPEPNLGGYVFLGWTNSDNNLVSNVAVGTTGNITLHANWTSKRNQTRPVTELKDPIICDDVDNGRMLFVYEIGQIENVPLQTLQTLAVADGIITVQEQTTTNTISNTEAKEVATTVANTTTNSTAWGLSEDWNNVTSVNKGWAQTEGITTEEAETIAKSSSNTYTFNRQDYDGTVVKTNSGTCATTTEYGKKTTEGGSDATHGWSAGGSLEVSGSYSNEHNISSKVLGDYEISGKIEGHYDYDKKTTDYGKETTDSGKDTVTVTDNTAVTTTDKGWKTDSGYSSSSSTSSSQTVSKAVSSLISENYGYGSSYSEGGSRSSDAAWSSADTKSNQFASTMTYYTSQVETSTTSYTTNGQKDGYYRLVLAGTVHVFAVVGYDVATSSYYVYTYNVLDDKTYQFIDYSRTTPNFDDNENGILPFNVPYFVNEYVDGRILYTDGLEIDTSTGMVTNYTGSSETVIIPEFYAVDNLDGTKSAITITGISENAFKGNTSIEYVYLSRYIDSIPDHAFEGCTALKQIRGSSIVSTGTGAFAGCTSLTGFGMPNSVTSLGDNAFRDVPSVSVEAANLDIVQATISSGAKNIKINVSKISEAMNNATLVIPSTVETFELQGGQTVVSNLRIQSDATTTILNGITITDCSSIPLEISSSKLSLRNVTVNSPSYALLMRNSANVELYAQNNLNSSSGNAVVCRDLHLVKVPDAGSVACGLNVSGNVYVYGLATGNELLKVTNGEIIYITEDEFNKYIKGSFNISLDANGGTVADTTVTAFCGTPVGTLPVPTRDYYEFAGWYTASGDDGELVDENTVLTSSEDLTLYAHWSEKALSDWVLASAVPDGAKVVNTKYSFTHRYYSESSSASKDGWTRYDTKRTGWGGTQGPVYSDPSNGSRNVWPESYVTSSNYKTIYHYYRYASVNSDGGGESSNAKYGNCVYYREIALDYELGSGVNSYGTTYWKYYYNGSNYVWYFQCSPYTTQQWVSDNYGTRWYYQEPVYTYYFYQDVAEEAASSPSGSEYSNIQTWVQYRSK